MIQIFAMLIRLVILLTLGFTAIVFLLRSFRFRKNKRKRNINIVVTLIFVLASFAIGSVSLTSQDSTNRAELVTVFKRQFGFNPPSTVDVIKAKRFALYEAEAEWICFTYDTGVLDRILEEDSLLIKVLPYSKESEHIINDINNPNGPDWLELPDHESSVIYMKEDYLNHIQSDYYLWVNEDKTMIYLQTSDHD